jgi:hypothetical protein
MKIVPEPIDATRPPLMQIENSIHSVYNMACIVRERVVKDDASDETILLARMLFEMAEAMRTEFYDVFAVVHATAAP